MDLSITFFTRFPKKMFRGFLFYTIFRIVEHIPKFTIRQACFFTKFFLHGFPTDVGMRVTRVIKKNI